MCTSPWVEDLQSRLYRRNAPQKKLSYHVRGKKLTNQCIMLANQCPRAEQQTARDPSLLPVAIRPALLWLFRQHPNGMHWPYSSTQRADPGRSTRQHHLVCKICRTSGDVSMLGCRQCPRKCFALGRGVQGRRHRFTSMGSGAKGPPIPDPEGASILYVI